MTLFDFDDILIEPTILSDIRTRSVINAREESGYLPLFTAPMDTVICDDNFFHFMNNGIMPVTPRIQNPKDTYYSNEHFLSYSMTDFERLFIENTPTIGDSPLLALIDVANGHMIDLHRLSKVAKLKYGSQLKLMVGNVANPDTFTEYCRIGVDYVRIGIGNGGGCLTTVQTGVGYPMASLIRECFIRRDKMTPTEQQTKIVADGGFKKYSDIIKALALGADYVMLGSILNKCLESCGDTTIEDDSRLIPEYIPIDQYSKEALEKFNNGSNLYKVFRGMSTKEVQKSWGKSELTTSEGVIRQQKVEYTIKGWVHNFESYLKSAMSYTGKKNLPDFIGKVRFNSISMNSFKRFDK